MDRLQRASPFAGVQGQRPWWVPGRSPGAAALLLLAAALTLAACGKVGPPQPPGPPDQVIWPHAYPTPHPAP